MPLEDQQMQALGSCRVAAEWLALVCASAGPTTNGRDDTSSTMLPASEGDLRVVPAGGVVEAMRGVVSVRCRLP